MDIDSDCSNSADIDMQQAIDSDEPNDEIMSAESSDDDSSTDTDSVSQVDVASAKALQSMESTTSNECNAGMNFSSELFCIHTKFVLFCMLCT